MVQKLLEAGGDHKAVDEFDRTLVEIAKEKGKEETAALLETEGERCLLLVGGDALRHEGRETANRLALHSGASLASNNKVNAA